MTLSSAQNTKITVQPILPDFDHPDYVAMSDMDRAYQTQIEPESRLSAQLQNVRDFILASPDATSDDTVVERRSWLDESHSYEARFNSITKEFNVMIFSGGHDVQIITFVDYGDDGFTLSWGATSKDANHYAGNEVRYYPDSPPLNASEITLAKAKQLVPQIVESIKAQGEHDNTVQSIGQSVLRVVE